MSAADEIEKAFSPLLERTKRRAERVRQLQQQPASAERDRSIAAEQREIRLFTQVAKQVSGVVDRLAEASRYEIASARVAIDRVQDVVEEASHFEMLFNRAIAMPDLELPDEKWPPVAARAAWAMYRMRHMHTSPETYAETFGLKQTA